MTYGESMREARLKRGFTQRMLEIKCGVSVRNINNYENDKNHPTLYNLVCLADALGISIDEYIGRAVVKVEEEKQSTTASGTG